MAFQQRRTHILSGAMGKGRAWTFDKDGTAGWAYGEALLALRKAGDTGETRKL
jgi:hypothetical protein